MEEKLKFAVFVDYDNIEIGVRTTLNRELDIECMLEGIKQRGEIVSKIAYGNWSHHTQATRSFTEFGVQMVQRDSTPRGDKNGADINLALDALEMAFTRDHINAFAIVSGDSDFMSLVNKLKQFNKRVYIVGGKQFTSTVLQRNCHEFISYESLLDILPSRSRRGGRQRRARTALPIAQAIPLLDRALRALDVRDVTPQLGLLKSTMLQLDPAFSERDYGVSSFSDFVNKLVENKYVQVRTVDNHQVVDRPEAGAAPAEESATKDRTEALRVLQESLLADVDLLEMGIPERELEALVRAADPDFDETDFGFQEFGELLNLAEDKGLLKTDTDARDTWRFFPGPDLESPLADEASPPPAEEDGAGAGTGRRSRGRRRRRKSSRGGTVDRQAGEASAEPAPEVSAESDEQPAPVRKTAAKRTRKTAARKAASSADDSGDADGEQDAAAKPAKRASRKRKTASKKAAAKSDEESDD